MSKTLLYIGAGILFLIGLCLVGYGVLSVIGSTSTSGSTRLVEFWDRIWLCGRIVLRGGAGLIYLAMRGQKTEVIQQVTMQVDLARRHQDRRNEM